jgi:phage I-like protein
MFIRIQLSEGNTVPNKIQILRTGDWKRSPIGKPLKITPQIITSLKENFDQKVRGYDDGKLPVDYFHDSDKVSAGWIEALTIEADGNELWAEVKWTNKAMSMLSEGEVRYVSVEFDTDYQDVETGKKYGPTLFGAGLTNRPFVKKMQAVANFSEGEAPMMTPEQMMARIKELEAALAAAQGQQGAVVQDLGQQKQMYTELKTQHDALVAKMAEEKKANEQKDLFNKMLSEGKAVEAQREAFMSSDMVKFAELAQPLNLKEKGSEKEPPTTDDKRPAMEQVMELAEKHSKEKGVKLSDSISHVLRSNKDLNEKYQKEAVSQFNSTQEIEA